MRVFIIGKNEFIDDDKKELEKAESWLRLRGNTVINSCKVRFLFGDLPYDKILFIESVLLEMCDGVLAVKGWEKSNEKKAQIAYAKALGKEIIFAEQYKDFNPKRAKKGDNEE